MPIFLKLPVKNHLHGSLLFFLLGLLLLSGCVSHVVSVSPKLQFSDAEIRRDTVWKGSVLIDGSVRVYKGVTLTIEPGTEIRFVRRDADGDGLGDGTLIIEGTIRAEGTAEAPILFASAADAPRPGDWLEIRVDFCREALLRHCIIRDSAYTLHAHFTRATVEDCIIRGNIDGCRLGQGSFLFRNCLIEKNRGKGINFRNSTVELKRNIIRFNDTGIFLFENDRTVRIRGNNIYGNGFNFRLGDFYTSDVELMGNWWGTPDPEAAAATIYDRTRDATLGEVTLFPASTWVAASGPRRSLTLTSVWQQRVNGFVDASPVMRSGGIVIGDWGGTLYSLDGEGKTLWQRNLGDVVDSAVATDGERLFIQTWGREVVALRAVTGEILWRFNFSPSRADDHRQGGVVVHDGLVLVPAWNGILYALDSERGEIRWKYDGGQPLRSSVAHAGDRLYLASGSGRLSALSLSGEELWQVECATPLLSTPLVTPYGVIVLDRDGTLYGFDPDGNELWRRALNEGCYYAGPVQGDGALLVATAAGSLWKLSLESGETIWRRQGLGPIYTTPQVTQGMIVVGDNDGELSLFSLLSGDELAHYRVEGAIQSTPLPLGDQLIFGARDHRLHAVTVSSGEMP